MVLGVKMQTYWLVCKIHANTISSKSNYDK